MGKKVFANGMEIAHKAGNNMVTAAFPDVCLSPPSPPAGPLPIPYPNTSKAGDLQSGSSKVSIGGQPLALKDQSFYKTAPAGDEAATNGLGAGIITHVTAGKTYFGMASMDVKVEGKPVTRHLDITTSNHAAQQPGNEAVPMPSIESMDPVAALKEEEKCKCCGGPKHSAAQNRAPMTQSQYYAPSKTATETVADAKKDNCPVVHADESDPCAAHYPASPDENDQASAEYQAMMSPLTPESYFVEKYGPKMGKEVQERGKRMREALSSGSKSIAHKTPRSAGGCPIGEGNLAPVNAPCDIYEDALSQPQSDSATFHRKANGLPLTRARR